MMEVRVYLHMGPCNLALTWVTCVDFSESNMIKRYKDLAGQLGNLLSRSTGTALNPDAMVPAAPQGPVDTRDQALHKKLTQVAGRIMTLGD